MDTRIWNILGNHIKGESDQEEEKVLQEWLEEHPGNVQILEDVKGIWEKTGQLDTSAWNPVVDIDQEWEAFTNFRAKNIETEVNEAVQQVQKEARQLSFPSWLYRVAAAIVLGFGLIYYFNYSGGLKVDTEVIVHQSLQQRKKILLPDQSEIWLNKQSELSYDSDFGTSHRTVSLKGEAFFDIEKDRMPFVIHGTESKTEVLGTAFNLRSYPEEKKTELILIRGSVAFSEIADPNNRVVLIPGEKAILSNAREISKTKNTNLNFLSWKNDLLTFNKSKFKDVVRTLENHFDVKVIITNKQLYACRFTGSFENPKLDEVLAVLSASLNLDFSIAGDRVTLAGDGCSED